MTDGNTLSEIAEITMGQSPSGSKCNEEGVGIPLLNGPTEFGQHHPTPVQFTTDARKTAHPRDLLFCVRGSTTGRMNWANREYAIGRGIASLRHKEGMEFQPFLRAVIEFHLSGLLAEATGSTFPNVSFSQLHRLRCYLPPLPEQKAIADILGSLDDKIELNRRTNETLEAMARAIFKSWFVDFDPVHAKSKGRQPDGMDAETAKLFPSSFEESEIGRIPKEWNLTPFSETVEILSGGTPKTTVVEFWGGNIPWFSVVDSPNDSDVFVMETEKTITQSGVDASATQVLPFGTTIISARGTVGKVCITGVPTAMNQSCYGLRGRFGDKGFFTYYSTRFLVSTLQNHSHGSVFATITRSTFDGVNVITPSLEIIRAFENNVDLLLCRIRSNLIERRVLSSIRDALLPRLLSGDLRVQLEGVA